MEIPNADSLFLTYFAPWYPHEAEREYPATRPDLEEVILPEGIHIDVLNPLTPEGMEAAKTQIAQMKSAALSDWPSLLGVAGEPSLAWIEAFDAYCTQENVLKLLQQSDPKNFANTYVVIACECGAIIGDAMIKAQPGLQWLYDWPYWDSAIFDLNTKAKINVFHWAFKRLAGDGLEDKIIDKVNASLQFVRTPPDGDLSAGEHHIY
jgi:hypothetical protein